MADEKKGDAGGTDTEGVNDPGKLDEMKKVIAQRANQMHDLEQKLGKLVWQQMSLQQAVAATRADVAGLQERGGLAQGPPDEWLLVLARREPTGGCEQLPGGVECTPQRGLPSRMFDLGCR